MNLNLDLSFIGLDKVMAEIASINTRLDNLNANLATLCQEIIKLRTEIEALPEEDEGTEAAWDKLDEIGTKGEEITKAAE